MKRHLLQIFVLFVVTATTSLWAQVCVPNSNNGHRLFIDSFSINTLSNTNSNYNSNTYQDFSGSSNPSHTTDLVRGQTYTISITADTDSGEQWRVDNARYAVYFDFNDNDVLNDGGELIYRSNSNEGGNISFNYTIPVNAPLNTFRIRIRVKDYWISNNPCNNMGSSETEDYLVSTVRPANDMLVTAATTLFIDDGATITSGSNDTNFGAFDIFAGTTSRTYTITNGGSNTLTLTGGANAVQLTGDIEFSVTAQPTLTTLTAGQSTTFTISYDPAAIEPHSATVSIANTDPIKNPYNFLIEGEGKQTFPDTDGDGISDNVDQDDDNDGILDGDEQNLCVLVSSSQIVSTVFLSETFGAGNSEVRINDSNPDITTTYCFEDYTTAQAPDECDTTVDLNDGQYTISNDAQISAWAADYWYTGGDHTGDPQGRMALFNADLTPGEFYNTQIDGVITGVPVTYSFYALNLDRTDAPCLDGCPGGATWDDNPRLRPRIRVEFRDTFGNPIIDLNTGAAPVLSTGDIAPTSATNPNGDWYYYSASFRPNVSTFSIVFINDQPGGLGNDLAIDDILITQDLCDLDGDGVADVIDIDNDNDGIPNIIEIGLPSGLSQMDSDGNALTTGSADWVDSNSNGVHDSYESYTPLDTDGDGIPDYLDLDSDNDGLFDALEYDGFGDIDVNGDGVGEGDDTLNDIHNDHLDGDGYLDPMDTNDDDANADDHGTGSYALPIDADSDGIPDYLDLDSNDASNDLTDGSDIDQSFYQNQDSNNDGQVDNSADVDRDGVFDGNGDYDTSIYGAPIDLDRDLYIDFDGRNDYLQVQKSLTDGAGEMTMMGWVLVDPSHTGNVGLFGDRGLRVQLQSNRNLRVIARTTNGASTSNEAFNIAVAPTGKWIHVAVTFDGDTFRGYINGKEEATLSATLSNSTIRGIATDWYFTIGKHPTNEFYFDGGIDEVRLFDVALSRDQINRMVGQEIEQNGTLVRGKVLPKDFAINWSNLIAYYNFGRIEFDELLPQAGTDRLRMYNIKTILPQTAPMPYVTVTNGSLGAITTLINTEVWDINDLYNYDFSIVETNHQISIDQNYDGVGLVVGPSARVVVSNGYRYFNDWYITLNGTIDLLGDAQLIQTIDSDLNPESSGRLLRKQQGEIDVHSYNYWSSPVGERNNTTNNNNFYLSMLQDNAGPVSFTGPGSGTPPVTSPVTISGRWLYMFLNGSNYNHWQLITPNATPISAGLGWSQKGTGAAGTEQEYIFEGKPNNGTISINAVIDTNAAAGDVTSSLLGNPYPSALDIRQFISDNLTVIDGKILIWDQFRGTNHQLAYYEGGYATVTMFAAVRAPQYPGLGYLNGGNGPAIIPTFFLPVSQGFFVELSNNGTIEFNNDQRVFKQESSNESIFLSTPGSGAAPDRSAFQDTTLPLIRLELISDDGGDREIVIGFDNQFTDGYEKGYDAQNDAVLNDTDLFVANGNERYIIAAMSEITPQKVVTLGAKGVSSNLYKFRVKEWSQFDPQQEVWLLDNELNTYHDLRLSDYHFTFTQDGLDMTRFEIVFENPNTLSTTTTDVSSISLYYDASSSQLLLNGVSSTPQSLVLYDMSGKSIIRFRESELQNYHDGLRIPSLAAGVYVVNISTNSTNQILKLLVQ